MNVIEGPIAYIGPREAHLLMVRAGLEQFRIDHRGEDEELDAALYALHAVGLRWDPDLASDVGSDPGSRGYQERELRPMTTTEVARHAKCDPRTVRLAAEQGRLAGELTSGGWSFTPDAVRTWTASRRGAAA